MPKNKPTRSRSLFLLAFALFEGIPASSPAAEAPARPTFLGAKTCFQTNVPYDPRVALAVDAVIVHRHGDPPERLRGVIASWKDKGYVVGRMFFADSDATNAYWKGRWDGTPHPEDVERNAKGEVVKCAGVRPYMLPTEGWIRHLEEMAIQSIDAGADAILPEEPLAHAHTGYEGSFKEAWLERYGRPWQAESSSPEARFLTAQLKCELYIKLETRIAAATKSHARKLGKEIAFVMPVHGLYSNIAAGLVAPLGTSLPIEGLDGYIGQVWTGPVNWAAANYDSPEKSFFHSAFVLYDSFGELARGTGKKLWLLSDPVEDDPAHEWSEFEQWYKHCVVAKLLFPEADSYEVMPWPDRIFLPGYGTGGGTPAPERFRVAILSAVQVLQEVPARGEWCATAGPRQPGAAAAPSEGIGVAVADTILWEKQEPPLLQDTYALLLPLVRQGVPVSACILERGGDKAYMSRFKVIVLSQEAWKPIDSRLHSAVARWVEKGGSLVLLGKPDDLGGAALWWKEKGHAAPLHHLMASLGIQEKDGDSRVGKGWVLRRAVSPRSFADPDRAREGYLPLLDLALRKAGVAAGLRRPGYFCLRRGPFLAAHAGSARLEIPGKLVDIFDPDLPVLDGAKLEPGASGLFRDVTGQLAGAARAGGEPCVLHATHRLIRQEFKEGLSRAAIRGPAETPAVVRFFTAGHRPESARARSAGGKDLEVKSRLEGSTLLVRFPNDPGEVTLEVKWAKERDSR